MRLLVAIEARRLLARRLLWVLLGGATLGILIVSAVTFGRSQPPDAAFASRERERAAALDACLRGEVQPFAPGAPPGAPPLEFREEICRNILSAGGNSDQTYRLTGLRDVFGGTTAPLVLMAWVIGASFVGAEWRAGTMSTLLTWEPRRVRVMLAKAIVAAAGGAAIYLAVQALIGTTLLPSAFLRGTIAGADAAWVRGTLGLVARGAALAAVGGAIGFSLGALGRNTAAALGIGFVYLAIVEGSLLGNLWPWIRRWLVVGNSIVFVSGERDAGEVFGRSPPEAGLILALYAAGLVAVATAHFRARDVG